MDNAQNCKNIIVSYILIIYLFCTNITSAPLEIRP
jgi:hypothetical protein